MRDQEPRTQLHSPAGTHPPAPQPHPPPLPAASTTGGRSRLTVTHLAFLCLAVSTAAAWFVEPFVVAAEFRLPAPAVAVTVLLLAACFHGMVHLVHSFSAPRPPPATATAAAAMAAGTIAVTAAVGIASCLQGAWGAPQEYRSAYS